MAQVETDLKSANQNWRQALYDRLVTDLGLGIGAAVKVQQKNSYYARNDNSEPKIAIITKLDLDKCNLFSSHSHIGYDYAMAPTIEVMMDGRSYTLNVGSRQDPLKSLCGKDLLVSNGSYYGYVSFVETIGRCETPLDEEWVKEGLKDEFEWLLKKKTKEKLEDEYLIQAINRWKSV